MRLNDINFGERFLAHECQLNTHMKIIRLAANNILELQFKCSAHSFQLFYSRNLMDTYNYVVL